MWHFWEEIELGCDDGETPEAGRFKGAGGNWCEGSAIWRDNERVYPEKYTVKEEAKTGSWLDMWVILKEQSGRCVKSFQKFGIV